MKNYNVVLYNYIMSVKNDDSLLGMQNTYSEIGYYRDIRTLKISCPRQSGKTSTLLKIFAEEPSLFVSVNSMFSLDKSDWRLDQHIVKSVSDLNYLLSVRPIKPYSFILIDEPQIGDYKKYLIDRIVQSGNDMINKRTLFVSVGTDK